MQFRKYPIGHLREWPSWTSGQAVILSEIADDLTATFKETKYSGSQNTGIMHRFCMQFNHMLF